MAAIATVSTLTTAASAYLPAFDVPNIELGPITLQAFGILVATGVLVGAWISRMRGRYLGIDENVIRTLTGYLLVGGFLGAHLFDVIFYQWHDIPDDPLLIVKVWQGISSYGGFLGAGLGFAMFCKVHRIARPLVFADITMWGGLIGFTFGRMGCTVVFDHPGSVTDFALGMDYPFTGLLRDGIQPGTQIHNLGFYELLFLLGLITVTVLVTKAGRARPVGFVAGFSATLYGPVRFMLDFLRFDSTDPRRLGLTFAQYISIATFFIGVATLVRAYKGPKWDRKNPVLQRGDAPGATEDTSTSPGAPASAKAPATKKRTTGSAKKRNKKRSKKK